MTSASVAQTQALSNFLINHAVEAYNDKEAHRSAHRSAIHVHSIHGGLTLTREEDGEKKLRDYLTGGISVVWKQETSASYTFHIPRQEVPGSLDVTRSPKTTGVDALGRLVKVALPGSRERMFIDDPGYLSSHSRWATWWVEINRPDSQVLSGRLEEIISGYFIYDHTRDDFRDLREINLTARSSTEWKSDTTWTLWGTGVFRDTDRPDLRIFRRENMAIGEFAGIAFDDSLYHDGKFVVECEGSDRCVTVTREFDHEGNPILQFKLTLSPEPAELVDEKIIATGSMDRLAHSEEETSSEEETELPELRFTRLILDSPVIETLWSSVDVLVYELRGTSHVVPGGEIMVYGYRDGSARAYVDFGPLGNHSVDATMPAGKHVKAIADVVRQEFFSGLDNTTRLFNGSSGRDVRYVVIESTPSSEDVMFAIQLVRKKRDDSVSE